MNPNQQNSSQPGGTPAGAPTPEPVAPVVPESSPAPTPTPEPAAPAPSPTIDFTPPSPEPVIATEPTPAPEVVATEAVSISEPVATSTATDPIPDLAPEAPAPEAPIPPVDPTPVVDTPVVEEPVADITPETPSMDTAPAVDTPVEAPTDAPGVIAPAPKKKNSARNIIIVTATIVVLVAVAFLTYKLVAPSLQPESQGSGQVEDNTDNTPDPYEELLAQIKSDNPGIGIVDLDPEAVTSQITDIDLNYILSVSTLLTDIGGAEGETNSVVGVNVSINNRNEATAFSIENLTVNAAGVAYKPVISTLENTALTTFINKYGITSITDVNTGDEQSGWLFFEVPKTSIDALSFTYTRDSRLELDAFTAKVELVEQDENAD